MKPDYPDYFAELYVAGKLADAGWNIYFPHRDKGFDFIIGKEISSGWHFHPVQVKGKFPTTNKKPDKPTFGYVGKLKCLHQQMILAIAFFPKESRNPCCVGYMPLNQIRRHSKGYRCEPAKLSNGIPLPRREYKKFFDESGISLLDRTDWHRLTIGDESQGSY